MLVWFYKTRCLNCGLEDELFPRDVRIGPFNDQVITGTEDVGGIEICHTKPLYTGTVSRINCPVCLLKVHIASDLAPHSLRLHVQYQDYSFHGLQMERIFDGLHAATCRIREFPVSCPRCDIEIPEENMRKRCVKCFSKQVQVIRSGRVKKDE